jgi:hypothetical protein
MRVLIAGLLSVLLVHLAPSPTHINNSLQRTQVQAVQAEAPRKEPTALSQEKALTEQQIANEPEKPQGCEVYRNLISQYAWNTDVAIAVCNAESNGNPTDETLEAHYNALGQVTCYGSKGLFQIGCDSTDNYQGMGDPKANIAQAYALYERRNWQPWSATTCKFKVQCY